jgi:hypothetical protein
MDHAVSQSEMRHVVEEDGGDAMAFKIKRGNCGHGFLAGRIVVLLWGLLDVLCSGKPTA